MPMNASKLFTEFDLRRYDGESGPMYIAYDGTVYNVTDCPHWRKGLHQNLHFPGQDLTLEFAAAPHGIEVFKHPCVKIVGQLISSDPQNTARNLS